MEKKYLIDSDILIDYLRGFPPSKDFLIDFKNKFFLFISVINIIEIYSGKDLKSPHKKKLIDSFLNEFEIIELDEKIAKKAGEIRRRYQMPFADAIISASAIENSCTLVTRNVKHFSKVKELKIFVPY